MGPATPTRVPRSLLVGCFSIVLGFYWFTLCPTVHWDDSGELIAAAYVLGVPHPPGQPLYTMLGWVFTHLPFVPSPAYGMNLMSAVFGAVTWTLMAGWLWQAQRAHDVPERVAMAAAALAAFTGAAGAITWYQSVIAENTTLHTTFVAALLWWAWRIGTAPPAEDRRLLRHMLGWSFVYGLSATNHPAGMFLFPAFAAWFLYCLGTRVLRPHWVLGMLACAAAGLLPYGYLYLASLSDPSLDWGNPENWTNFWWVVSAQQYKANALPAPTWALIYRGSWNLLRAAGVEWGIAGVVALFVGWVRCVERDKPLALWPLPVLAIFVYLSANPAYIGAYLVPAFLFLVPALAEGFAWVLTPLRAKPRAVWAVGAAIGLVVPGGAVAAHWTHNNLRHDDLAKRHGEYVLGALPKDAVIITESAHLYFVGLYLKYCESYRPDVVLLSANAVVRPGYLATLRTHFPQVAWPEDFGPVPELGTASMPQGLPGSTTPPWVRDFLVAVYEANAATRRVYFENITPYAPIFHQFVQAGYVFELQRPLAVGREPAWRSHAGEGGVFRIPAAWDERVDRSEGARLAYSSAVSVVAGAWGLQGRNAAAASAFALCVELDPSNPGLYTNLGIVLAQLGRNREAEAAFRKAIQIKPESGLYAANFATFYRNVGKPAESLRWTRHALNVWRAAPTDFLLTSAQTAEAAGDADLALTALRRAQAAQPENPAVLHALAGVALRAKRPEEAEPAIAAVVRIAPDTPLTWVLAAWLAAERGDERSTIQSLIREASARDPAETQRLLATIPALEGSAGARPLHEAEGGSNTVRGDELRHGENT